MLNKKTLFVIILALYILPTFIQVSYSQNNTIQGIYPGLPFTQTGDEPHYYITLYSLVNDYDIFLTNNYNNALYRNGSDLGFKRHNISERHTLLFNRVNKTVISVPIITTNNHSFRYVPSENSYIKEIPSHATGLPLFAFLFLWPFKNTSHLEHFSMYLTAIFSLLGIYAMYALMLFYHRDERKAQLFTLVFAFGTQYWHYSKTFWVEPYLASFLIISWYLIVIQKTIWSYLISGFLLGFGFLMKYPFVLTIVPFYFYVMLVSLKNKKIEWAPLAFISIPLLLCGISVLYLNYFLTNNMFAFNQLGAVHFANPLKGMFNWLFDSTFGLIPYAPILLFSLAGIRNFWKEYTLHCITVAGMIISYFLFWASYVVAQQGAGGYSARYVVPLIAFLVIFCSFSNMERSNNAALKYLFYGSLAISISINFLASIAYPAFMSYPLFVSLEKFMSFVLGRF